jgi:mannose-6-phosphate isomerase
LFFFTLITSKGTKTLKNKDKVYNSPFSIIDNSKFTFAEYWLGSHHNGESMIEIDEKEKLKLSEYLKNKGYNNITFLFKILSINNSLSIQIHPNKEDAEYLNIKYPLIYTDNNHKPELAIVISDNFEMLYGLKSLELVKNTFEKMKDLKQSLCDDNLNEEFTIQTYEGLIDRIIKMDTKEITNNIDIILKYKEDHVYIVSLFEKFGYDRGIIFSLFMNYVTLKKGDSVFIEPNVPHAYMKGDCVECMANSDNVIRLWVENYYNLTSYTSATAITITNMSLSKNTK